MSFEATRQHSSAFSTLVLSKSMSKQELLRTLMTSSTYAMPAAFSKRPRETTRRLSSILARLRYLEDVMGREENVAAKRG